ncbi:MAG: SAM-dependent methyltransferase, partial [Blastocatellia bacterium]
MSTQTPTISGGLTQHILRAGMRLGTSLLERDVVPDVLLRAAIRQLLRQRLHELYTPGMETQGRARMQLIETLRRSPVAINTVEANTQHYEVPADFFRHVMGPWMKYSCGYWPEEGMSLAQSEEAMLRLTCQRARITSGQRILDLGCGWGALSLYLATNFPGCEITAVSNSRTQKQYIEDQAARRGLTGLRVITADMNDFASAPDFSGARGQRFDRIVSVEMFEHMR